MLAVSGSLGNWACGARTGFIDEIRNDGGGLDVTTLDATGDVPAGPEAGDVTTTHTPDSAGDVAADVTADVRSGLEPGDAATSAPSCAPGGPGMTNCGPGGSGTESCCTSLEVCGGTYFRGYKSRTEERAPATVSSFRLDKYLVTAARFRQFVNAWNGGYHPAAGSGKHTHLNGGKGLANSGPGGGHEPGWSAGDDSNIDPTNVNLACNPSDPWDTWTDMAGSQENLPINCVNWYEAYAFCIWDGGFLPSLAEAEYAAAGGNEQREYPWGSTAPGTGNKYAIYNFNYPSSSGKCSGVRCIAPVGTASLGAGRWGQLDMAGELWEMNLDGYANTACTANCADTSSGNKSGRGGSVTDIATPYLHGWYIVDGSGLPVGRDILTGFRCARTP